MYLPLHGSLSWDNFENSNIREIICQVTGYLSSESYPSPTAGIVDASVTFSRTVCSAVIDTKKRPLPELNTEETDQELLQDGP